MKTFCLFLAVALAYSVGATFIEGLETNRSHIRKHESSKQLVPIGHDSSKQVQLIETDQKEKTKVEGFAAILLKWGSKCTSAYAKAFPVTSKSISNFWTKVGVKTGWTKGKDRFDTWSKANPAKAGALKFVWSAAFAVGDAVVSTLIVAAFPPAAGVLIADAAWEFAASVFDLAGGEGTDYQTARVAWQGLALVLAIGGIDGQGAPGADASALCDAMGSFWYGAAGNTAGEFADAMGGNLAKLNDAEAKAKAEVANTKVRANLGAGRTVKVGSKNRKIMFLEDHRPATFKTEWAEATK